MWIEYILSRRVCHLNKCRNKKTYDNMIVIIAFINGKRLVAKKWRHHLLHREQYSFVIVLTGRTDAGCATIQ